MLKLTQKPPLTYAMVQWLVVLARKRQQQERQKQTSNRFNVQNTTQRDATKDDDFIFLFQNLDVVPKNTNPGKYTVI